MRRLIAHRCDTPFISYIDWDSDLMFIKNPSNLSINIGGYKIKTKDANFEYIFPTDYMISSHSTLLLNFHPDIKISDNDASDSYYFCSDKLEINDSQMQEIKDGNTIYNISVILYDSSSKQQEISCLKYKIMHANDNSNNDDDDDDDDVKFEVELSYFDWILSNIMLSLCYIKISTIFSMVYCITKYQYFIFSTLWLVVIVTEFVETLIPKSIRVVANEANDTNTLEMAIGRAAHRIFNSIIYFSILFATNNDNNDNNNNDSDRLLLGIVDINNSSIMGVILAIELFSEELYQNRVKISVYRDTLDAVLQYTTLLPLLTYFASNVFLFVEYNRNMNYTLNNYLQFVTSIFSVDIQQFNLNYLDGIGVHVDDVLMWFYLLVRSAFLCRIIAYILQMIDATASLGKFS